MMNLELAACEPCTAPRIDYAPLAAGAHTAPLPADVLAAIVFGGDPRMLSLGCHDPRFIQVGLDPLGPAELVEVWRGAGTVSTGSAGPIRFAMDEEHLAGSLEVDEREHDGLAAATEWAYAAILRFQARSPFPHLLRMWNYFDGINRGAGDEERYKQFCIGRAAAFRAAERSAAARPTRFPGERPATPRERFPAATAIGRRDGSPILQIYWLASRHSGAALENPRQMSAYRYPREYGPAAPTFSRAMLAGRGLLLVSGTASIVGHASQHRGSIRDQLGETLANLSSIIERAAAVEPALPRRLSARTRLKIYLRDRAAAELAAAHLTESLPRGAQFLILQANICRAELLVEVDCVHA